MIELGLQRDFVALADRQFLLKSLDKKFEATKPDLERKSARAITGGTVRQACSRFATLSQRHQEYVRLDEVSTDQTLRRLESFAEFWSDDRTEVPAQG